MPSENLKDLKAELVAALAVIKPQIEGLEDFGRLNLLAPTREKIVVAHTEFKRREALLEAAIKALGDLETDTFPEMPSRPVAAEVYADLKNNVETLAAAFGKFTTEQATALGVELGAPELKTTTKAKNK